MGVGVDPCRVVGVDQMAAVVQMTRIHQGRGVGVDQSMKVHQGMVAGGRWCLEVNGISRDIVEGLANFFVDLVERQCVFVVVLAAPAVLLRLQWH